MSYPPVPPAGFYPPPGSYPPPGGFYQGLGQLPTQAYTSWLTRVAAYLIDLVPVAVLTGIGQAIQFATMENTCGSGAAIDYEIGCMRQSTTPGVLAALGFALLGLAFAVWNYGYRQGTTGSSVGKSVMKFKVVAEATGRPIGFGHSVLRQLAHIIDGLICNIGYLFPLWDAKRQTIADKIMSTVCLPDPHPNPNSALRHN